MKLACACMRGTVSEAKVSHAMQEQAATRLVRHVNVEPIYRALLRGDEEKAHLRFTEIESLLTQRQYDRVIRSASRHNRLDFLRRHVDDRVSAQGKQIALYAAAAWGQTQACKFWVLDGHVDVHAKPTRFKNPYPNIALRHHHVDTAAFFFDIDRSLIEEPDGLWGDRPIHVVNIVNSAEGLALLARLHANLDSKTAKAWFHGGLHIDAYRGYCNMGADMLERGANPNVKDIWGRTPLDIATTFRQSKFARLLQNYDGVVSDHKINPHRSKNGLPAWQRRRISYELYAREVSNPY